MIRDLADLPRDEQGAHVDAMTLIGYGALPDEELRGGCLRPGCDRLCHGAYYEVARREALDA